MDASAPETSLAFAKILRSYQGGWVPYTDLLGFVNQQLATGAPAEELLDVLELREREEPLPHRAYEALVRVLTSNVSATSSEAVTIVLQDEQDAEGDLLPGQDTAPAPRMAVGDVLAGRYRLTELIGEGGMSFIYRALDTQRESTAPFVGVKILKRTFNNVSASFEELQEKVRELSRLRHPNIVELFDCERDGPVFITMEFLAGTSLYARLRARATPSAPQNVIRAVADALTYAHEHHIVHGDLKPENVIITERGEVKVIDFGIANWIARPKSASERREAARSTVASAVTPRYASPQMMARQKPEVADDVYAFACMVYELCTGLHPFDDEAGAQTLRFPPPQRHGLTAAQYAAVLKGLQFERRNRTATIGEFMAEFDAPELQRSGNTTALWVGLAALILLGTGVYLYVAGRTGPGTRPPPTVTSPPAPLPPPSPVVAVAKPGTTLIDCETCPGMTVIAAGQFTRGSPSDDAAASAFEKPQQQVDIRYSFALSTNDVTVGEFGAFVDATHRNMQGCETYDGQWRNHANANWQKPGFTQTNRHPVTCVSWNDAVAYAEWLSAKSGHRYRLPSASEWEYAARAGQSAVTPWASPEQACGYANVADQSAAHRYPGWDAFRCSDKFVNTSPVGSFEANAFGLSDMLGNVFQWTADCWHANYSDAPADGSARSAGDCSEHELRGGSWFSSPAFVRTSYRNHFATDYRTSSVGFRLVRELNS